MISQKLVKKYIPPNIIDFNAIKKIYRYKNRLNSLQEVYVKTNKGDYVNETNIYKILIKSDAFTI